MTNGTGKSFLYDPPQEKLSLIPGLINHSISYVTPVNPVQIS